ncbi:uncharacterized protein [Rutidosis leptorrhynchoides]|uniref:uncharacterized protein n=1 Tax=Rutidosis leptorrhynchoides TaxID=125765 RepID=UPI003A994A89
MSRCFPYPPPGYFKDGATTSEALIESIKLQKENDKAKAKAERKREKREKKDKKPKDQNKSKDEKKVKSQNYPNEHPHDSHKVLPKVEVDSKKSELKTELLERSDVTEEHGQPHKPSYSSDSSTQNSNKRKFDDASLSEVATAHGKPIKIRLLKKQKESDSVKDTNRPSVTFACNGVNETSVSHNRTGVSVTSGRENNAVNMLETKNIGLNEHQFGQKKFATCSARPSFPLTNQTPNGHSIKTNVPALSQLILERPVLAQCQLSTEISGPKTTVPSGAEKRSMSEVSVPVKNGPSISEKKTDRIPQKVAPTRHEKKMLKKQSKYEKLVRCWVPPVVEAQLPVDEEVWLSRRVETIKSSSRNDAETCRESAASLLWQPFAHFLVEADMHALPYTVPF